MNEPTAGARPTSSEFLRDAVERVSDGFVVFDREFRVLYMNEAAEAFWGRRREELLGRMIWEALPQAAGSESERLLREAASHTTMSEFQTRSGVVDRWTAVRVYPHEGGVAVYFRDITEQRLAEEKLKESETRFRALFENIAEGICLTAPGGRIFAANPAACAMFGRSEAEIRKLGRSAVVDMADPRVLRFLENRRKYGRASSEHDCVRADGSRFPVETTSVIFKNAAGEELTAMTFHDVSERKRAQQALELLAEAGRVLASSLDYPSTIANVARLPVPALADTCIVDLVVDGKLQRIGVACRDPQEEQLIRQLRTTAGDGASAGPVHVVHTGQVELHERLDARWFEEAAPEGEARELLRRIAPRSVLTVPLMEAGEPIGALTLAMTSSGRHFGPQDVALAQGLADRAATAIQNAQLYAEALEAKRLRDETLGVVSHDLRNPLNTIGLVVRVLQKRGVAGPEMDAIKSSLETADRLIHDLLTATVAESGKMTLELAPCSPEELVRETVRLHAPLAEGRSVALEGACEDALPLLLADRHRLLQLFDNLIGNALKFTPDGGKVRVFGRRAPGGVELGVTDSGPGIPPEHLKRLFDRFWQGATSRKAGAGLGLSIVKGIAEAHGGSVRVESQVGHGSTFVVLLPAAPQASA